MSQERHNSILSTFKSAFRILLEVTAEKLLFIPYEDRLEFYSLFKQATSDLSKWGKPNITQYSLRVKWFSWQKYSAMSKSEAMIWFIIKLRKFLWLSHYDFPNLVLRLTKLSGSDKILKIELHLPSGDLSPQSLSHSTYYPLIWFSLFSYLPIELSFISSTPSPDLYPLLLTPTQSITGLPSILRYISQNYVIPSHLCPVNDLKRNSVLFGFIEWYFMNGRVWFYKERNKENLENLSQVLKKIQEDYLMEKCFIGKYEIGPSIADLVYFGDLYYLVGIGFVFDSELRVLEEYSKRMKVLCLDRQPSINLFKL